MSCEVYSINETDRARRQKKVLHLCGMIKGFSTKTTHLGRDNNQKFNNQSGVKFNL